MSSSIKSLKLQNYFVEQIELEQRFLVLNENQRDILKALLVSEKAVNEYELRMRTYYDLISSELFRSRHALNQSTISELNRLFEEKGFEAIRFDLAETEEESKAVYAKNLSENLKKGLNKKFKDYELFFRFLAKELRVNLPSNARFRNDLEDLVQKKFVVKNSRTKPKRVDFSLEPSFFAEWKKVRLTILDAIKKKQLFVEHLTNASREFWNID